MKKFPTLFMHTKYFSAKAKCFRKKKPKQCCVCSEFWETSPEVQMFPQMARRRGYSGVVLTPGSFQGLKVLEQVSLRLVCFRR